MDSSSHRSDSPSLPTITLHTCLGPGLTDCKSATRPLTLASVRRTDGGAGASSSAAARLGSGSTAPAAAAAAVAGEGSPLLRLAILVCFAGCQAATMRSAPSAHSARALPGRSFLLLCSDAGSLLLVELYPPNGWIGASLLPLVAVNDPREREKKTVDRDLRGFCLACILETA